MNFFFNKKKNQIITSAENSSNTPSSAFNKLLFPGYDHDFKLFNTARFVIGTILLVLAPPIATLAPFISGESAQGLCKGNFYDIQSDRYISLIEFTPKNSKQKLYISDENNSFGAGEITTILYLENDTQKAVILSFQNAYNTFWTGISIGLLVIWVAGFYASRN